MERRTGAEEEHYQQATGPTRWLRCKQKIVERRGVQHIKATHASNRIDGDIKQYRDGRWLRTGNKWTWQILARHENFKPWLASRRSKPRRFTHQQLLHQRKTCKKNIALEYFCNLVLQQKILRKTESLFHPMLLNIFNAKSNAQQWIQTFLRTLGWAVFSLLKMVVLSIASQSKLSKRRQASVLEAAQSEKQVSRMVPDRSQSFSTNQN